MAVANATITVTNVVAPGGGQPGQGVLEVYGTVAVDANPATYATGGITMSFAGQDAIKSSSLPIQVTVFSAHPAASPQTNAFEYRFAVGTTLANGTLQIFTGAAAQTALTELSAGAVPAGVSGDTIKFKAIFPRNI